MTGLWRDLRATETIDVYPGVPETSPDGNRSYRIAETSSRTVRACSVQPVMAGPEQNAAGFLEVDTYRLVLPRGQADLSTRDQVEWRGERYAVVSAVHYTGSPRTAHTEYKIRRA